MALVDQGAGLAIAIPGMLLALLRFHLRAREGVWGGRCTRRADMEAVASGGGMRDGGDEARRGDADACHPSPSIGVDVASGSARTRGTAHFTVVRTRFSFDAVRTKERTAPNEKRSDKYKRVHVRANNEYTPGNRQQWTTLQY